MDDLDKLRETLDKLVERLDKLAGEQKVTLENIDRTTKQFNRNRQVVRWAIIMAPVFTWGFAAGALMYRYFGG